MFLLSEEIVLSLYIITKVKSILHNSAHTVLGKYCRRRSVKLGQNLSFLLDGDRNLCSAISLGERTPPLEPRYGWWAVEQPTSGRERTYNSQSTKLCAQASGSIRKWKSSAGQWKMLWSAASGMMPCLREYDTGTPPQRWSGAYPYTKCPSNRLGERSTIPQVVTSSQSNHQRLVQGWKAPGFIQPRELNYI